MNVKITNKTKGLQISNEEEITRLDIMNDIVHKMEDINNSYSAIVIKITNLMTDTQGTEDEDIADNIAGMLNDTGNNSQKIQKIYDQLVMKRNQIEMEE